MTSRGRLRCALASAAMVAALSVAPAADACGGFFCSQSAPVNQAAERIIFADNGDGTVTAVIQIVYEGPAESFSWLLPISTVPEGDDIAVASNMAFQRLQAATNPQYSLTTRVEGACRSDDRRFVPTADGSGAGNESGSGGVVVAASGIVGAFEWQVISLDPSLADPADVAVTWLETNGYDVAAGARGLLRPYLEDGLNLLALRLTKGADTGSIRPIVLTYAADKPMIPIKLTAVAANENMGVLTWLLGEARGVPQNYLALELNEAKINWFNPSSNYNDVVNAAADEAGGQGFVTEFADMAASLNGVVWTSSDDAMWETFRQTTFAGFFELFDRSLSNWGEWDGFWDVARATVTLPAGVDFGNFRTCPACYADELQLVPADYIAALESGVIEPVRRVQTLLDARPYVTRLYTTMSAGDMTVDPLFTFNPDLPAVSNIHTAERVIECNGNVRQSEATWRIELPQGGVIRGTSDQVGTWPEATADQPSNAQILRLSESGAGVVVEDNRGTIEDMLDAYNATVPRNRGEDGCGCSSPGHERGRSAWLGVLAASLVVMARRRGSGLR